MWVCRLPVHIGPAGCTGFTEILGEFVTSHWADRVVGPYGGAFISRYLCSGPTESSAPTSGVRALVARYAYSSSSRSRSATVLQ